MAAASGQAMVNASQNEGGAAMAFMGMNMAQQNGTNMLNTVANMQPQQPAQQAPVTPVAPEVQPAPAAPVETPVAAPADENPYAKLVELKKLLDAGVISQADFDAAKAKVLGI